MAGSSPGPEQREVAEPLARRAAERALRERDIVELAEAVDDAPAGARGGVLEVRDGKTAMVEVLEPKLGPAARIVFAPLEKLRIVERGTH